MGTVLYDVNYEDIPVITAELGWSHPCDMWSVGCIMFELYRGFTLFQTHNNREHLGMMETILGPLPPRMCRESAKSRYFTKSGQLDWEDESIDTKYISEHCFKLKVCVCVSAYVCVCL